MNKQKTLITVMLLGSILRLINLNQSLWLDEAAQAIESAGSFQGLFHIVADFMPPLFHLILHFWMKISHHEVWMRLLPVGFGVGTIYLTYKVAMQLFSKSIALTSAFLLAISPFHVYYSQELRPYALATFLASLSTYFLLRSSFLYYTISSTLLVYSLYTTPFLLMAHGIYILLFKKVQIKAWILSMFIAMVAFLPWFPVFRTQLFGGTTLVKSLPGWSSAASEPPVKALLLTVAKFMLGRITIDDKIFYGLVFLILFFLILMIWAKSLKKHPRDIVQMMFFILIPTVTVFLISFFLPIIAPQRLLFVLPFFLTIMAAGIGAFRWKINLFLLGIFMIPNLFGLWLYFTNPRFQREQWQEATAFVEERSDPSTAILFAFPEPFAPFLWYRKNSGEGKGIVKDFTVSENDLVSLGRYIENKNKIFYFQYLSDLTDPSKKISAFFNNRGLTLLATHDFPGVGFIYEYAQPL